MKTMNFILLILVLLAGIFGIILLAKPFNEIEVPKLIFAGLCIGLALAGLSYLVREDEKATKKLLSGNIDNPIITDVFSFRATFLFTIWHNVKFFAKSIQRSFRANKLDYQYYHKTWEP